MPKANDFYKRSSPGKRARFATFDFETQGLGGKVIALSYMTEDMLEAGEEPGYYTSRDSHRIIQFIWDVMCNNNEFHWFAHNAQYELTYFIPYLEEELRACQAENAARKARGDATIRETVRFSHRTDLDIYKVEYDLPGEFGEGAKIIIRDSAAVWMEGLDGFTKHFCPPELQKLSGTIDFEGGENFDPLNPEHVAYSKRDSHALLVALIAYDKFIYDTFDVRLRWTAAGTAMAAWQRTLDKDECYYNSKQHEAQIRKSYYGGLVFLTDTNVHRNARSYDISSSYPYQMITHAVPVGNPRETTSYIPNMLGAYHVTVKAPDNLIVPILPVRDNKGIVWPSGTFSTYTTSVELQFALDHGYRLLHVHSGLVWRDSVKPFDTFIGRCMNARKRHKGTGLEQAAKRMQNGVSGKFGAKRERKKLYAVLPEHIPITDCTLWGEFYMADETEEDMACLPQWIVFITARARIHLLTAVYAIGPENCLYGDTDSITVKEGSDVSSLSIGKEYGQWSPDKSWATFRVRGPKVYGGILRKGDAEKWAGAAKGIPRKLWEREGIFEAIHRNDEQKVVSFTRPERFTSSLKSHYVGPHHVHRSLSVLGHSRSWCLLDDGTVRPTSWTGDVAEARQPAPQRDGAFLVGDGAGAVKPRRVVALGA